ncbi:hypothetical protein ACFOLF_12855 [Paenibacillus sepulcri]|uniref:Transposase n=1 Tax=Paenibacillus sepulcri TaxID=359917 RepID=A0ABS7C9E6_9BACL|nr:hypothetical protein [Paenibacillus sepulcri]
MQIAKLLEPSPDQTSESVRFHMEHLLNWMQQNYNKPGDEVLVNNVLAYTKGFWNGLFTRYDAPHVPRTNNDHERFFHQTKTKYCRMTGRRRAVISNPCRESSILPDCEGQRI